MKAQRNIRYYVDTGLGLIVIISGLLFFTSIWSWPPATWDRREAFIGATVLAVSLVLAREKRIIVAAAAGYVVCRSLFALVTPTGQANFVTFFWLALLGTLAIVTIFRTSRDYEPRYDQPNTPYDLFVGVVFFGAVAVGILVILRDTVQFYLQ